MAEAPAKWLRSPSSDGMLALFALTTLAGGVFSWFTLQTVDLNQLAKMSPDDNAKFFAFAIPIAMFLAGGVCLLWASYNRAAGVALEIDEVGLTDHRGVGRVLWKDVQSLDAEIGRLGRNVPKAVLVLYVGHTSDQLRAVEVSIQGLDAGSIEIVRQAKLAWMKVVAKNGGSRRAEPGAAADGGA